VLQAIGSWLTALLQGLSQGLLRNSR